MKMVEIMAPAGNRECLMTAIKAGANSVYFGVSKLNMRSRGAKNFDVVELPEIVSICDQKGIKSYLTLNTVIYDDDIQEMRAVCDAAKSAGISAVIAMDIAVMQYARSIGIAVHLSTQVNVSNMEAVKFFSQYCDTIVLARELSLAQIKKICSSISSEDVRGPSGELVRIEVFVHGALCVSISGKCYMSLATYGHSANRGDCLQNCRRNYLVTDSETGDELTVENGYVMSPRDMCTIGMVDKLVGVGINVFKIEGRARKPDYVDVVVRTYKEAVASVLDGSYDKDKIAAWTVRLQPVYNRGFWTGGYYLGKKLGEWSNSYGSLATKVKKHVGDVLNYYAEPGAALVTVRGEGVSRGDEVVITGPTTGLVRFKVTEMRKDNKDVDSVQKGDELTFIVPEKVRVSDQVFVVVLK